MSSSNGVFTAMYAIISVVLLMGAFCVNELERVRWYRRFRLCRWNVSLSDYIAARINQNSATNGTAADETIPGTNGVKSSAFESEIRENFLIARMNDYSTTLTESDFVDNVIPSKVENEEDDAFDNGNKLHMDYNDYVDTLDTHEISSDYLTVLRGGDTSDNNVNDHQRSTLNENSILEEDGTTTIPSYTQFVDEEITTSINNSNGKEDKCLGYTTDLESAAILDGNNIDKGNISIELNASVMPTMSNYSKNDDGCSTDNNSLDCSSADIPILEDAFDDTDSCIKLPIAGTKYFERTSSQPTATFTCNAAAESKTVDLETKETKDDRGRQNIENPSSRDIEEGVNNYNDLSKLPDENDVCNPDTDEFNSDQQQDEGDDEIIYRHVPGGCVICLCPYEVGELVTWSSNTECKHSFHNECIIDWLKTSGKRSLKQLRRNRSRSQQYNNDVDILAEITSGPWACPVCRQDFIVIDPSYSPVQKVLLSDSESHGLDNNDTRGPLVNNNDNDLIVDTVPTIDASLSADSINGPEMDINTATTTSAIRDTVAIPIGSSTH